MELPRLLAAGVYRTAERYRQRIPVKWLSFYVRGRVYENLYFPDGKLCAAYSSATPPVLTLGYPGMKTDFEFGPDRENWVLMLDWPALDYRADRHEFLLREGSGTHVLPASVFPEPFEIPLLREQFCAITKAFRGALPRNLLTAELLLASLLSRFLAVRPSAERPAARLKKLIDEDTEYRESVSALSLRCGFNRDYLRREFQKDYALSPGEYRRRRRLQEIIQLILYSQLSVKEIAYQAGLKHVSHLYALLREHCDCTPAELCRRYRKDAAGIEPLAADPTVGPRPGVDSLLRSKRPTRR